MKDQDNLPVRQMSGLAEKYTHIKGWGIDADLENDPTYPIKRRTDEEQLGQSWERPELQPLSVEILPSNERNNLPAVFGTTLPPSGLSGMIRRFAFRYSESDYAHWLPLMLADRIGVVEGLIDDLSKGHIPNIPKEKGWGAQLKYNRKNFLIKTTAVTVLAIGIGVLLLSAGNRNQDKSK